MSTCTLHGSSAVAFTTERCPMCALSDENQFLREEIHRLRKLNIVLNPSKILRKITTTRRGVAVTHG